MKWFSEWRVKFSIFVACLNTELIVIPLSKWLFGLEGSWLKFVACSLATAEIIYWFLFVGWVIKKIKEADVAKEGVELAMDAIDNLKNTFLGARIEYWVKTNIVDPFDPEKHKNKFLFALLKGYGIFVSIPLFFCMGIIPTLWIVGVVVSCSARLKVGFVFLILGNIAKNIGFAEGWDLLWKLF